LDDWQPHFASQFPIYSWFSVLSRQPDTNKGLIKKQAGLKARLLSAFATALEVEAY
jgi:hypothetical protein